jgi:hypothetical protein
VDRKIEFRIVFNEVSDSFWEQLEEDEEDAINYIKGFLERAAYENGFDPEDGQSKVEFIGISGG